MLIDQIASNPFTIKGSIIKGTIQRRRELHKLFYTPQRRIPEMPLPPVDGDADFIGPRKRHWLDAKSKRPLARIKHEVAKKHEITVKELEGKGRDDRFTAARLEYYFRAKTETHYPFSYIGNQCGGRDHSTVLNGFTRYQNFTGLKP